MTVRTDEEAVLGEGRSYRYFRNAVERHWDPGAIDLSTDRDRLGSLADEEFDLLREILALFGAGEEAVTDDLAPLAVVLEDANDQAFVASQMYEEGKHADFFQRYWDEVVHLEERARGMEVTAPTDERWFNEDYVELFDRTEAAMERLLTGDTPENRASAYCHYHLTVEGVLAQTGYYAVQTAYSGDAEGRPELPGLVEGFSKIRADEGRHVGFGMAKLKDLIESGAVDSEYVTGLAGELSLLPQGAVGAAASDEAALVGREGIVEYAAEKHRDRMEQVTEASEEIPGVEELVELDG